MRRSVDLAGEERLVSATDPGLRLSRLSAAMVLAIAMLLFGAGPAASSPVSGRYEAIYDVSNKVPFDTGVPGGGGADTSSAATAFVENLTGCGRLTGGPINMELPASLRSAAFQTDVVVKEDHPPAGSPVEPVSIHLADSPGPGDDLTITGGEVKPKSFTITGSVNLNGQSRRILRGTVFVVAKFQRIPLNRAAGACGPNVPAFVEGVFGVANVLLFVQGDPGQPARILDSDLLPFGGYSCRDARCARRTAITASARPISVATKRVALHPVAPWGLAPALQQFRLALVP
jgi:hypothetical protein